MKKFEKNAVWMLLIFLLITGFVYLYFRDFAPPSKDPFSVVSSPWQSWMIKLHVLLAPLFVFLFGWIFVGHVLPRLNSKKKNGKKSGLFNVWILGLGIMSGYLIQVVTHEKALAWISNFHIWVCFLCVVVIGIHQWLTCKK